MICARRATARVRKSGTKFKPHPNAPKAAVVEAQIVELLRVWPVRQSDVARATLASQASVQRRLKSPAAARDGAWRAL
jgi:hypothetical protein